MNGGLSRSMTFIELLVALILMSVLILGFTSIDLFSRYYVLSADRRSKVQNTVSYVLKHMSLKISQGIGDESDPPDSRPVNTSNISGDRAVRAWIDFNGNARRDAYPADRQIAYRFTGIGGPVADRYQIWYCPECTNNSCTSCNPAWGTAVNILSKNIREFDRDYDHDNDFVDITLTGRWDPAQGVSKSNPEINMRSRIKMPSVSTD